MTQPTLSGQDLAKLRMFRNVIAELHGLMAANADADGFRMVRGYVESEDDLNRLRAISIPVRRAYLATDPVHFGRMCAILAGCDSEEVRDRAAAVRAHYDGIQHDLDSVSILDDTRIAHSEILEAWLEAALYRDFGDRGDKFNQMASRFGKTIEGIAWHLTERVAEAILMLDELVAAVLGESGAVTAPKKR